MDADDAAEPEIASGGPGPQTLNAMACARRRGHSGAARLHRGISPGLVAARRVCRLGNSSGVTRIIHNIGATGAAREPDSMANKGSTTAA